MRVFWSAVCFGMVMFSGLSLAKGTKGKWVQKAVEGLEGVLVSAPQDQEVCFSPMSRCDLKLLKFVESVQKSLDIAVFDLNLDELVHAILLKAKNIPVRVLVDQRQAKGKYSLVSTLARGGVQVRVGRQRGVMHHKFTLVDGKRLETGSFNYTNHAARANQENQIYLGDRNLVAQFHARFEDSWNAGKRFQGQ